MEFGTDSAENYYDEGLTASMKGDLDTAIHLFEKAIRLDSTMASAYHQLGKCYQRKGKPDQAIALLKQVVTNKPQNTAARLDLGFAMLSRGLIDEARRQFVQVAELNPSQGKAQLGLAQAFFREGNWRGALDQAQVALATGGANFPVHYMLGRAAKLAGDATLADANLRKADNLLQKSLEVDAQKAETHFLRGEVAFIQEQYAAALEHYSTAAKHAQPGPNQTGQMQAGRSFTAYGESFSTLDILAKRGLCLQRMGQHDKAQQIGEEIGRIDPEHKLGKLLRESAGSEN